MFVVWHEIHHLRQVDVDLMVCQYQPQVFEIVAIYVQPLAKCKLETTVNCKTVCLYVHVIGILQSASGNSPSYLADSHHCTDLEGRIALCRN